MTAYITKCNVGQAHEGCGGTWVRTHEGALWVRCSKCVKVKDAWEEYEWPTEGSRAMTVITPQRPPFGPFQKWKEMKHGE